MSDSLTPIQFPLNGQIFTFSLVKLNYSTKKELRNLRFKSVQFDENGKPTSESLVNILENNETINEKLARIYFAIPSDLDLGEADGDEVDAILAYVDSLDILGLKKVAAKAQGSA